MNDRRSGQGRIPGYSENAALQLVAATGLFFIMFFAAWVTMVVFGVERSPAQTRVYHFVGLAPLREFLHTPWTLLTYGLPHDGFWEWVSNAIWIYTFGSVLQNLIGYRQVIPIFVYGLLMGGIFCLAVQFIPAVPPINYYLTGARSGVLALAIATITAAPRYRFFLGPKLSFPLAVVVGIFIVLCAFRCNMQVPLYANCAGGMLAGFLTVRLLQAGYRPGAWMYSLSGGMGRALNPEAQKLNKLRNQRRKSLELEAKRQAERDFSQGRVDEILDKINQRGYGSLSTEERDILLKASKEPHN